MKNTTAILKKIYPLVEASLKKNTNKYKAYMCQFISVRSEDLYDIAPCRRIYFTENDTIELFKTLGIEYKTVSTYMQETYYAKISAFNPAAAKDETTAVLLCVLRYFWKIKDAKMIDLAIINLAFSGKFYPSIHYGFFKKVQPIEYRHIMDYVVNNMLSNKFDLKSKGNVIGAIKSIANTWLEAYGNRFRDFEDEDCVYVIQQLHSRIKSFLKNIASLYYEAYENKSQYINYASDDYSDTNFRIAETDNIVAERIIDRAMTAITTQSVNYKYCKMSADSLVRTDEIKDIIEWIIKNDTKQLTTVREYISLIVYTYFEQSPTKDVRTVEFIKFSIQPKPNSKDKNILRIKEITEDWLMRSNSRYIHRKNRLATKNSYTRSVIMYFTLLIHYNAL